MPPLLFTKKPEPRGGSAGSTNKPLNTDKRIVTTCTG